MLGSTPVQPYGEVLRAGILPEIIREVSGWTRLTNNE